MKKNKMMRLASVLLVCVLLTTSVISGTFAKYVTTAEGTDSARVAKWGVTITMSGDDTIFKSVYAKDDTTPGLTLTNSVEAATNGSTQDKVVAPGTTGSTTFSITGTPEVAVKLDVVVTATSTIKLAKDTDYTMAAGTFEDTEVKVQPTADYEPIRFKLEKKADTGNTYSVVKLSNDNKVQDSGGKDAMNLTLAELRTALESLSKVYEANTKLDATYQITWTWPFTTNFTDWKNDTGYKTYTDADILDTYLGNETTAQKEEYTIKVTATQVD